MRQWQHWGSGCYNYVCEDNRLHIIVLNSTYTCFYGGQELKVQSKLCCYQHGKISLTLLISDSAAARRGRVAAHGERGVPALPRGLRRQVPRGGGGVCPAHQAAPLTRVPPTRADMRGHVSRVRPRDRASCQSDRCVASHVTHVSSVRITFSQETKKRIIHADLKS